MRPTLETGNVETLLARLWEQFTKTLGSQKEAANEGKLDNLKRLFWLAAQQPGLELSDKSTPFQVIAEATANLKHQEFDNLFPRDLSTITLNDFFDLLGYNKDDPGGIGAQIAAKFREGAPTAARSIALNEIWT